MVGAEVWGFSELMIFGNVKSNANMPNVRVSLLPIFSDEFSNKNMAPSK
jgi:hypothetical protein